MPTQSKHQSKLDVTKAGRILLLGLTALVFTLSGNEALAQDRCHASGSAASKAICSSAKLREQDREINLLVSSLAKGSTSAIRQSLLVAQRQWLVERARRCVDGNLNCLFSSNENRLDILHALAARTSSENPTLPDTDAVALIGNWRIGPLQSSQYTRSLPPWIDRPDGLPEAGIDIVLRPGQLCRSANDCQTFGLEPQKLGSSQSRLRALAPLGLPPSTPFWLVYVAGRASFGLIPYGLNGVAAVLTGCDATLGTCRPVLQPWTPNSPNARMLQLSP